MLLAEGSVQPKALGTLPDAMYWAITTLTTVGYGDIVPVTAVGRLIAGVTMVIGLLLFALPIGIIANGFVNDLHRHWLPYRFFKIWSRLAGWHRFVQHDGPISISRAFVTADWRRLIARAGIAADVAKVEWWIPFRLCVARMR